MAKNKVKQNSKGEQMSEEKEVEIVQSNELEALETEIDKARLELERTKQQIEEKKKQLENIPAIVDKQVTTGNKSAALKDKIAAMKEYDNVKVTGKFMNRRAPGQIAKLTYMKYEDDPVKWYTFVDGGVYTIPRGFADQINEHYYRPHFIQKSAAELVLVGNESLGESSTIAEVDTSNKSYAFVPVNF